MSDQRSDPQPAASDTVQAPENAAVDASKELRNLDIDPPQAAFKAARIASDAANAASITAYKRSNKLLQDQLQRSRLLSDHRAAMQIHKDHIAVLIRHARVNTAKDVVADPSSEVNTAFAASANAADVAHDLPIILAGFQLCRMKVKELRIERVLAEKQRRCIQLVEEAERRRNVAAEKKRDFVVLEKRLEDVAEEGVFVR